MAFPLPKKIKELRSIDQREVAVVLSELFINQLGNEDGHLQEEQLNKGMLLNKDLQDKLRDIRDIIWSKQENVQPLKSGSELKHQIDVMLHIDKDMNRQLKDQQRIQNKLKEVPKESREAFVNAYVRLGHLYEIAGHIARKNLFQQREQQIKAFMAKNSDPEAVPTQDIMVPGGVHEMLFYDENFKKMKTAKEVIEALSKPVTEYVFTQHPTNTNTLESMQRQRHISRLLAPITNLDAEDRPIEDAIKKLEAGLARFANEPVVQNKNFTAYDETAIVINFLTNVFNDVDRQYELIERGLTRRFGKEEYAKHEWELDLKQRFSSWGSAGDKDGNANIKSENTLEAIVMHKKKAAELLAANLSNILESGETIRDTGTLRELYKWRDKLNVAKDSYKIIEAKIEGMRKGNDIPVSTGEFRAFSKEIQNISETLGNEQDFLKAIRDTAPQINSEVTRKELLKLHRKAKIFGFNLGKIEYRETAEVYSAALNSLLGKIPSGDTAIGREASEYVDAARIIAKQLAKDEDERNQSIIERAEDRQAKALTSILRNEKKREIFIAHAQKTLNKMDGAQLRNYKVDEKKLAEDIAAHPGNQEKLTKEANKLAEDAVVYHTLQRMALARDFGDIITHNVLAECKGTHNLLEAVALQAASTIEDSTGKHSAMLNVVPLFEEADTMAKIPTVLKDGLKNPVYNAHVEAIKKRDGTELITQQIQIAHSDNARRAGAIASRGIIHNGHHEARAAIDAYNKKNPNAQVDLQFFEGGSQSDSYRNGVRAVTAAIKDFGLGKFAKMTFQGGDLLNYFNQPSSCERMLLRNLIEQAKLIQAGGKDGNKEQEWPELEKMVMKTIADQQRDYDVNYYDKPSNPIGKILHALGYRAQAAAGSAGTRGNRFSDSDYQKEMATGVNPKAIRTISFSETLQHGGLHPSCLGTESLEHNLGARIYRDEAAHTEFMKGFAESKYANVPAFKESGELTATGLKYLYNASPTFKDAIDKMSYSLINTRVGTLTRKLAAYQQAGHDGVIQRTFGSVITEYTGAAQLAFKALMGREFDSDLNRFIGQGNKQIPILERTINLLKNTDKLDHYDPLNYKHRFADGLDIMEGSLGLDNETPGNKERNELFCRLIHNGRDTLYHGRTFVADDPNYGRALTDEKLKRAQQNSRTAKI